MVAAFFRYARMQGISLSTADEIDVAMAHYLNDLCYLKHKGFAEGSKLLSGFMAFFPEFKGHLPLAARSVVAWQRLAVQGEGGPVPFLAVMVIALQMIRNGEMAAALATLMAEDGYLRESDWASVCFEDIHIDSACMPPRVALLLGAGSRGLSTKTGPNQGVVIDAPLLRFWLTELKSCGEAKAQLIPLEPVQYRKIWWRTLKELDLEFLGPPHGLRHSRPSEQVAASSCDLEQIRRRGRWVSLKSVQRYTKSHELVRRAGLLHEHVRHVGQQVSSNPRQAFHVAVSRHTSNSMLVSTFKRALKQLDMTLPYRLDHAKPSHLKPDVHEPFADWSGLSVVRLRLLAKSWGLCTSGKKAELIDRLQKEQNRVVNKGSGSGPS